MTIVAAYQGLSKFPGIDQRLEEIKYVLTQADEKGIDLLCFPEGFLTGYYEEKSKAKASSLSVDSPLFTKILLELQDYRVTSIIGFNERSGNDLYNSAMVIENSECIGIQRKHFLYHPYFTQGTAYNLFQSKGLQFGVVICLDANYLEPSRILSLKGASVIFCPMCNTVPLEHPFAKRPSYYSQFVARSFENHCWFVAADCTHPSNGTTINPGHSCIYVDGQESLRSQEGKQDLLVATVNPLKKASLRMQGSPPINQTLSNLYQEKYGTATH